MRTLWPFLWLGDARDKAGSATMAVISEEMCILVVNVLETLDLLKGEHYSGLHVMIL